MGLELEYENKRRDHRVRVTFDALYSTGRREGSGTLVDFSYSGARLDNVSMLPDIGTTVRVYVFVQPVAPFEVVCQVVRHEGDDGFAIEFKDLDQELRGLVEDAAAVVRAVA